MKQQQLELLQTEKKKKIKHKKNCWIHPSISNSGWEKGASSVSEEVKLDAATCWQKN